MQNVDARVDQRFEPGFQRARRIGQLHFKVLLLPLADPEHYRKIRSDRLPHRVDDINGKSSPAGQVLASVAILAAIGTLPKELINQIAVRAMQFDGIEPQALCRKRRIGESANGVCDVLFAHWLAELLLRSRQAGRSVVGAGRRPILGARANSSDMPYL